MVSVNDVARPKQGEQRRIHQDSETIDGAETAINGSVDHYQRKLDYISGPKVVKTFK